MKWLEFGVVDQLRLDGEARRQLDSATHDDVNLLEDFELDSMFLGGQRRRKAAARRRRGVR